MQTATETQTRAPLAADGDGVSLVAGSGFAARFVVSVALLVPGLSSSPSRSSPTASAVALWRPRALARVPVLRPPMEKLSLERGGGGVGLDT